MQQRKSVLGVSQLQPSTAIKEKAIARLKLSTDYNASVMS